MSSVLSGLESLTTGSVETAVGVAIGIAAADALGPLATTIRQESYSADPSRALDPADAARIVAQALKTLAWGEKEAAASGIAADKFDLLEELEVHAPDVGTLLQLIRRNEPSAAQVTLALNKAQLDPQWHKMITGLQNLPLQGAELANAIHRGNMDAPSIFRFPAPTTPGKIPQYPVSPLDPFEQAAWAGTSKDQLAVLVANAGLPLALMEMLQLYNRGEVTEDDVKRAIAHSNIRNEYMDAALLLARYILTPTDYAEGYVRGWITEQAMYDGGKLRGVEQADMDLLYKLKGRPLPVHRITTGLARGGKFNPLPGEIQDPYEASVRQSSLRPEYEDLEIANKYTIPSYFVLKQILADGGITEAELAEYFKWEAYPPDLAEKAAAALAGGTKSTTGPYTKKAETQLWTSTHKSYVASLSNDAQATEDLTALGATEADIAAVLKLWQQERTIAVRSLTVKQIIGAIGEPGRDRAWAETELKNLRYSADEIAVLLYQPPATPAPTTTG